MQMTLVAVLADIHSNLPALKKVLEECDHSRPDMYLIAGDIVGYNPYPNEVIEELAKIKRKHMIMGNHDRATFTRNTEWFNAEAAEAVRWTRKNVKQENMEILGKMKDKLTVRQAQPQLQELRQVLTEIEKLNVEKAAKEIAKEPSLRGRIFEAAAILRKLSQ